MHERVGRVHGWVPEWLKGADCKSAGSRLRWFEPSPTHHYLYFYCRRAISALGNSVVCSRILFDGTGACVLWAQRSWVNAVLRPALGRICSSRQRWALRRRECCLDGAVKANRRWGCEHSTSVSAARRRCPAIVARFDSRTLVVRVSYRYGFPACTTAGVAQW